MDIQKLREDNNGELPAYAWPGGYPIYYLTADNGVLCPECANCAECRQADIYPDDEQWRIVAQHVNYEDSSLPCDNCENRIQSAYADHIWTGNYGFELELTEEQALAGSHVGQCDTDIDEIVKQLATQLDKIPSDAIRKELEEYGAWDSDELAGDEENRARIAWIACGDVANRLRQEQK